jgi:hypothetical protein
MSSLKRPARTWEGTCNKSFVDFGQIILGKDPVTESEKTLMESRTLQMMQGKRLEREKVRQQLRIQKLTRRRALQFQPLLEMRDEEYQAHRQ